MAEEGEGRGGRIYGRFGGNFLFKSRFVLSCFVLREIDVSGDGPEMQGVVVEDNHLRRTRGRRVSEVFSLVSFNRLERRTCAHFVVPWRYQCL